MNSTTWIIEPNGWAWGLLIIATAALCLIALVTMCISFRKRSELGKPKSNGVNSRTCTTFSIIACVLALIAIGGTFLDIRSNDASIPISILGTFVAALLGWQVFNAIENSKTLKKLDRLKKSLETQQQEMDTRSTMLVNRIEAMDMLSFLRNSENELNDRYFNGVRSIDLFLDSGIPDNFIYLEETLAELDRVLTSMEQQSPSVAGGIIADTEDELERMVRSIIRKIDETSEYLARVQTRINAFSRRRRRVCELAREARLNIAEIVTEANPDEPNDNGN